MRHARSGRCSRNERQRSTPLPSGRRTSSTATSTVVESMAQRLFEGARLGHHLESSLRLEQFAQSASNDLVVVNEEESDHFSPVGSRSTAPCVPWPISDSTNAIAAQVSGARREVAQSPTGRTRRGEAHAVVVHEQHEHVSRRRRLRRRSLRRLGVAHDVRQDLAQGLDGVLRAVRSSRSSSMPGDTLRWTWTPSRAPTSSVSASMR